MKEEELKKRFKDWALAVILLTRKFPVKLADLKEIRSQIIRSAASSAANYRAACRAKSGPDFVHKLSIVEEESDETLFWMEMIVGLSPDFRPDVVPLYKEGDELLSIAVASIKTAKRKQEANKGKST